MIDEIYECFCDKLLLYYCFEVQKYFSKEAIVQIQISIASQELKLISEGTVIKNYLISTGKNGPGEEKNSEQTPRGKHIIRAKIGAGCPVNTVFVGRRPTGEIYSSRLYAENPGRDWILTRIFWLSGLEKGKNRLGNVDTMQRYVYIHGTPDEVPMGIPGSRGCIRMRNSELLELFDLVPVGTELDIQV